MSNNLTLQQVAENQTLKEVSINTATGQLDAALTEKLSVDVSAGNVTLTTTNYQRHVNFLITGAATSGRTVTLPAVKKLSIFVGDASNAESVDIVKGSAIYSLVPGGIVMIYTDGTTNHLDVVSESSAAVVRPYDIGTFCAGVPASSEKLLRFNVIRAVDWAASMAGSRVTAGVAATAQTDFDLRVNGVSIGTIRFAAAGTVATYVGISATSLAVNDLIEIIAPGTADATLADISFTLAGVQS